MLRALRGDAVERPPVWMMRQAGRYMKVYQELCKQHTTFRQRSENVDVAVEVSLQPWRAFQVCRGCAGGNGATGARLLCSWRLQRRALTKHAQSIQPDGVILFSDILTPIAGMNIPFDIVAGKGPVIFDPIRTMEQARGTFHFLPTHMTQTHTTAPMWSNIRYQGGRDLRGPAVSAIARRR